MYDARPGEKWITLRVVPADGGFDHMMLRVAARGSGEAHFVDLAPLTSGEASSESMAAVISEAVEEERRSMWLRFFTRGVAGDDTVARSLQAARTIHQRLVDGNAVGALEHFDTLPDEVKRHRLVLLSRLRAASQLEDDAAYLRALEDLKQHHPHDPSWLMSSLDYFSMHERFDDALASLSALRSRTVDDAYLDLMEAGFQVQAKRYDAAEAALARARAKEPELEDIRWSEADLEVNRGNFQKAAAVYQALIDSGIEVSVAGIGEIEGYEAFAASKPYRDLLSRHGAPDDE